MIYTPDLALIKGKPDRPPRMAPWHHGKQIFRAIPLGNNWMR